MADIVLSTLNAKYIHASFGLRYLLANLGNLRERACIVEFDINHGSPTSRRFCWRGIEDHRIGRLHLERATHGGPGAGAQKIAPEVKIILAGRR
jgi:hypothetical protein